MSHIFAHNIKFQKPNFSYSSSERGACIMHYFIIMQAYFQLLSENRSYHEWIHNFKCLKYSSKNRWVFLFFLKELFVFCHYSLSIILHFNMRHPVLLQLNKEIETSKTWVVHIDFLKITTSILLLAWNHSLDFRPKLVMCPQIGITLLFIRVSSRF